MDFRAKVMNTYAKRMHHLLPLHMLQSGTSKPYLCTCLSKKDHDEDHAGS